MENLMRRYQSHFVLTATMRHAQQKTETAEYYRITNWMSIKLLNMKSYWSHRIASGLLLTLLCLAACSSETSAYLELPPDLAMPPPPSETVRYLLLRTARWPGGGREMTLGVLNQASGKPFAQDLTAQIAAQGPESIGIKTKVTKVSLPPGYTAILLPPSQSAAERMSLASAIQTFVASRPATERIALYRHGASVQLFSNFLLERRKLGEALDRYQKGIDGDANPLPLLQAIGTVVSDVRDVGGGGPDVMRSLIVLGKDPQLVFTDYPQVFVFAAPPSPAGLSQATLAIDEVRKNAFYKLASCSIDTKFSARVLVKSLQGELTASFPATLPEELGMPCNVDDIDSTKRVYTPRIELVFNDVQRAAHDARIKATQAATYDEALARSDFETQVRLAPGQATVLATAHLHGQGSLRCDRKSYTIQLTGSARYLLPDAATDEYTLISMCDDPAYVYAPTVFGLYADDLFTLKHRFVEFVIDGKTRGIYILIEKAQDELRQDHARTSGVLRRGYPVGTVDSFEVLYSDSTDPLAPDTRYKAFIAQIAPLTGEALISAARSQLDLDQYLRYLANQSILRSGDYIDEAYLLGTEQANGVGGTVETYRVMAWDPEGYTTCHSNGANAYPDSFGLSYCAEARLDFKLLGDPYVYKLFSYKLEESLNTTMTRDKMAAGLERSKTALHALLSTPAICAAMTELQKINPGAADCAVARSLITSRADAVLAAYDARRSYLLNQLILYRARF